METPKEYHYTYYSYEEYDRGYIGSRTCKCLPKEDIKYFGSFEDKTFKPTKKIILKSDYATREEAIADEIILQQYYKVAENPHFANKAYQTSTKFYVPTEQARENGKNTALKCKENGIGLFSFTKEERYENSKKGGIIVGLKHKENGTGIFSMTPEEWSENSRKNGLKTYENGIGMFSLTKEQRKELGIKTSQQRWQCTETGYISSAGALSRYQIKRAIDTTKRIRLS
jgi:hypothetical protein